MQTPPKNESKLFILKRNFINNQNRKAPLHVWREKGSIFFGMNDDYPEIDSDGKIKEKEWKNNLIKFLDANFESMNNYDKIVMSSENEIYLERN